MPEHSSKHRRGPPHEKPAAAEFFQRVAELLAAGDPQAARLLPELDRFPDFAPGWLLIGEVMLRAERREAALLALRRALVGRVATAALSHRIGQRFVQLGCFEPAADAFRKALSVAPDYAAAWYSLGLALQDMQRHGAAAEAYRAALRLQHRSHEAAFNLGVALQDDGRLEEALDAYAEALRLKPGAFARIAQALISSPTGRLWLRPSALRRDLESRLGATLGA
ncbi:MAG: tetratricopeptide repeat protein [Proteobacteria bacterium]|nr:tetratricopeptide repeat protein [Pseudomonadota bacterium]